MLGHGRDDARDQCMEKPTRAIGFFFLGLFKLISRRVKNQRWLGWFKLVFKRAENQNVAGLASNLGSGAPRVSTSCTPERQWETKHAHHCIAGQRYHAGPAHRAGEAQTVHGDGGRGSALV